MANRHSFLLACIGIAQAQQQHLGEWGPLISLPIVPMAGAILPQTNELLLWAGAKPDLWTAEDPNAKFTLFSTIDLTTMKVSTRTVSDTGHDMFCPGITMDATGQLVVSGGSTATPVSSYNPINRQWSNLAEMNIPRGYHSTVLTTENRIFAIGGSWSGGLGGKIGEIYDPATNIWNTLPGCDVDAILTNDRQGIYRSDNHANLFTWKEASVFQAGPSKIMHWFDTRGTGRTLLAGPRADADHAMCASSVMYDTGKILFTGGAPDYNDAWGVSSSYVISLDDAYGAVRTEKVSPMEKPRGLANAVVLPDGQVLVTGGQQFTRIFTDDYAVLTPELYNPVTKSWRSLANESTPRTYHAMSILLPDGTVFSGGGGACGDCTGNHLDGSIYKPPYLFKDGALAPRPVIRAISTDTVKLGGSISVTVDSSNVEFAFVRLGTVTHSINTDQRRVSVKPLSENGNTYVLPVPADAGVAPPGYWFVFALSNGVPSVARTIQFTYQATASPLKKNTPREALPCPGDTAASSSYTAPNGEVYAICSNANFNNRKDLTSIGSINSIEECSAFCSRTGGCTMVTYIPSAKHCYAKTGGLGTSLRADGFVSSIKVGARPCAKGVAPSGITTMTDGRIYGICDATDFAGDDFDVAASIISADACAQSCASRKDCASAAWMRSANACYMKKTLRPAKVDTRLTSIFRMQYSPCLNRAAPSSIWTANNGDVYGICQETDFFGSDIGSRAGVSDARTCAQACAGTSGCASATYIRADRTCYMKNSVPTAQSWAGRDAIFRISIAL